MDSEQRWFYALGGERRGPVAEEELLRLLVREEIPADTLVWAPGLDEWAAADAVLDFEPGAEVPAEGQEAGQAPGPPPLPLPPFAARRPAPPPPPPPADPAAAPQLRPWVRYWARMMDLALFSFLVGLALDPVAADFDPENPDYGFLAVSFFLVVLLEAVSIALWGTTPGKALLRVRLRRRDGGRLTFRGSVERAFRVFVVGEGMLLPVVVVVCMAFSFQRLMSRGLTWWDEAGGVRVEHGHVGAPRAVIAGVVIAAIVWLSYDWTQVL